MIFLIHPVYFENIYILVYVYHWKTLEISYILVVNHPYEIE